MDKAKFWEKQYRRGHSRIVGICYRYVNDWAVAQDLAQDVFLKAIETFKAYRAFGRFDAWLTRIAVNHCIDYLRQKPDFVALESEPAAEIVQTAATPGQIRHRHRGAQGRPPPRRGRGRHGRYCRLTGGPSPPRRPEPG